MRSRLTFLAVLAAATGGASAAPLLANGERALASLKVTPPCCVVDARNHLRRKLRPLADAVVWNEDTFIRASGTVVVIADDDRAAKDVGRTIEKRFKATHVLAIKGGIDAWESIVGEAQEPGMPATFVIPRNTCEQGAPLQTLRSNKR
jgi:hypothetical protein